VLDEPAPSREAGDPSPAATTAPDDALYCAACGTLVTRQRWAIRVRESHDHVVFNPAGRLFRVRCFSLAPGAVAVGPASGTFSWFPGLDWRIAFCRGCAVHLGWTYQNPSGAEAFWGLDARALTTSPPISPTDTA